jgi:hypothetical protein
MGAGQDGDLVGAAALAPEQLQHGIAAIDPAFVHAIRPVS